MVREAGFAAQLRNEVKPPATLWSQRKVKTVPKGFIIPQRLDDAKSHRFRNYCQVLAQFCSSFIGSWLNAPFEMRTTTHFFVRSSVCQ